MATIPSSGQKVPQIGIGCRNYRGALNSDEIPVFEDTLTRFHRGGGKILDTSPNYGNSEEIIFPSKRIFSSIFTRPKNSDSFLENSIIFPLHEDSIHEVFLPHLLQTFCMGQNIMLQFLHLHMWNLPSFNCSSKKLNFVIP